MVAVGTSVVPGDRLLQRDIEWTLLHFEAQNS